MIFYRAFFYYGYLFKINFDVTIGRIFNIRVKFGMKTSCFSGSNQRK